MKKMMSTEESSRVTARDVGRAIGHLTGDIKEWNLIFERAGYKLFSPQWNIAMEAANEEHRKKAVTEKIRENISRLHAEPDLDIPYL